MEFTFFISQPAASLADELELPAGLSPATIEPTMQ